MARAAACLVEAKGDIKVSVLAGVPKQENMTDCGVYVLAFVEEILKAHLAGALYFKSLTLLEKVTPQAVTEKRAMILARALELIEAKKKC